MVYIVISSILLCDVVVLIYTFYIYHTETTDRGSEETKKVS